MEKWMHNRRFNYCLYLIISFWCMAHAQAGWQVEVVDGVNRVWDDCSLALDSTGMPHIAYQAEVDRKLYFTWRSNGTWHLQQLFPFSSLGEDCSLAFNSLDMPAIAHRSSSSDSLRYTWFDGTDWQIETVDNSANTGAFASLKFDAVDRPHISYTNYDMNELMYTYKYAGSWHPESVGVGGYSTDLELAATGGYPHLCSMWPVATGSSIMYYRWKTPSGWMSDTINVLDNGGYNAKLSLDHDGNPMIATGDGANGGLFLLRRNSGGIWSLEVIDSSPFITGNISMVVDASYHPHITYYDGEYGRLKYARWTGTEWHLEVVDEDGILGIESSLILDADGYPHVAYYDYGRRQLRYAWWDPGPPWFDLVMADTQLQTGDTFELIARGGNTSATALNLDQYVLLDIFGVYYFYPTWRSEMDFTSLTLNPGEGFETNLLTFVWPSGTGSGSGLIFHGAWFTATTFDLMAYDLIEWGYGE